jgi:hypothetical protein
MTSTWRIKRHGRVNVGDCEGPVLELELALVAGQHDVGGLVQEGSHPSIPAFRDAAGVIDLSRLMAPWNQPQISANISGSADARRIVDRSHKGERCQLADAWDGHEPAAGRRGSCHASHVRVDRGDRRHHCGSCRNQSPHGGRKTGDPLACFKSLVDEGDDKRAGQSDPEHDRQAWDLIFQGHSLADSPLNSMLPKSCSHHFRSKSPRANLRDGVLPACTIASERSQRRVSV